MADKQSSKFRLKPDMEMVKRGWRCQCPKCGQGNIYKSDLSLSLKEKCDNCGWPLADNDCGDGPAVFLIFILGFLLVPLAILFEYMVHPPLWLHAVLWAVVALALTLGMLRPLKAYILALQYKHRPEDF